MKKLLFLLLALTVSAPAFAQTQTQYYTVPTIAALKAMTTSRPAVVQVVDANPGIFNLSAGACSAADDIFQVQPTSGTTVCYTRAATPYSLGKSATGYSVPVTSSAGTPSYITRSAFTSSISVDQYYSGSGTYDAAIAAAIAAAPSTGANILFTAGTTYAVSAPIAVNRGNLTFQCSGQRTCNIQSTSPTADMFAVNLTVATTTISTTSGSPTATVASATGITNGMQINSANVPAGTTVTISGTTVTLSANATGTAAGTSATFGNMAYDVYWEGLVFSRASTSSAGCQINARNLAYTGVSNSRFYGNSQSWKHVCLRSVNDFAMDNVQSDNPQNAHLTLEGITAHGYGTLDGTFIGLTLRNYTYLIGGHAATASPLNHGSIEVGDLAGGLFFDTTLIAKPRGYAVRMAGTSAGPAVGVNSLVFFNNLNVEGSGPDTESGGIYAEYYSNINVTGGWISGNGTPAIRQGANSSGITATGAQLVINGSSAGVVELAGSSNNISGNRIQSYNSGVGIGVLLAAGASSTNVQSNHFESLSVGISDGGLANTDISIDGNQFYNTATPIASAIYSWSKANIGPSNSNATGPLAANGLLSAGDVTLTKTQNAPNSLVCLNGSAGASSACRLYLQTGTANATVSLAMNDSGGSPYAALSGGTATSAMYQSFPIHNFTSQSGTQYAKFDSTGLVIDPAKALTYGGVTLSNSVTGTGSMVLSASPTLTGTLTAATIVGSSVTAAGVGAIVRSYDTTAAHVGLYLSSASGVAYLNTTNNAGAYTGTSMSFTTAATSISTALTYGGVTLSNSVTGTGSMVLSASPTFTGTQGVLTLKATTQTAISFQRADATLAYTFGRSIGNTNAQDFFLYDNINSVTLQSWTNSAITFGVAASFSSTISATIASTSQTNVACYNSGTGLFTYQTWATGCLASSARFKENIAPKSNADALKVVTSLEPVTFTYKKSADMGGDKHNGFIAEQVVKVAPDLVVFEKDGKTPRAVKYQEMAPYFAGAIRELKAANDNLKAEIAELKKKVK